MNTTTTIRQAAFEAGVVLSRTPRQKLGRCINIVDNPFAPCPTCKQDGPMHVFATAVRWLCGHTRNLPPLKIDCYAGCCHNSAAQLQRKRQAIANRRRLAA